MSVDAWMLCRVYMYKTIQYTHGTLGILLGLAVRLRVVLSGFLGSLRSLLPVLRRTGMRLPLGENVGGEGGRLDGRFSSAGGWMDVRLFFVGFSEPVHFVFSMGGGGVRDAGNQENEPSTFCSTPERGEGGGCVKERRVEISTSPFAFAHTLTTSCSDLYSTTLSVGERICRRHFYFPSLAPNSLYFLFINAIITKPPAAAPSTPSPSVQPPTRASPRCT